MIWPFSFPTCIKSEWFFVFVFCIKTVLLCFVPYVYYIGHLHPWYSCQYLIYRYSLSIVTNHPHAFSSNLRKTQRFPNYFPLTFSWSMLTKQKLYANGILLVSQTFCPNLLLCYIGIVEKTLYLWVELGLWWHSSHEYFLNHFNFIQTNNLFDTTERSIRVLIKWTELFMVIVLTNGIWVPNEYWKEVVVCNLPYQYDISICNVWWVCKFCKDWLFNDMFI